MSTSIEKFKLEERIRIAYLKHAGNVEMVATDCNVDYAYALKICKKFKKRQSRDINVFVGTAMASYVLMGAEERKAHIRELLNEELNKQPVEVSVCCSKPIKKLIWDNEHRAVCQKCEKDCLFRLEDTRDKNFILKLLKQLREDDETIVKAAEQLGFGDKQDAPAVVKKEINYNLHLEKGDQELLKRAEDLDPRSREALRNDLRKQMTDTNFEEKEIK